MPVESATELPAEIKDVIDMALGAFNAKDHATFNSMFGGEVAIIDGFAPFRWIGPDAQGRWWSEAERWAKDLGVVSEHIAVEKVLHWQVVGTRAYAVLSAILKITLQKGDPIIRPGILTYTLVKLDAGWKAEGHAWARLS
jgi:hypothetical protein